MFAALLGYGREAGAYFHALDRVDAHQRLGEIGVEPVENRLPETGGYATGAHANAGAD